MYIFVGCLIITQAPTVVSHEILTQITQLMAYLANGQNILL